MDPNQIGEATSGQNASRPITGTRYDEMNMFLTSVSKTV